MSHGSAGLHHWAALQTRGPPMSDDPHARTKRRTQPPDAPRATNRHWDRRRPQTRDRTACPANALRGRTPARSHGRHAAHTSRRRDAVPTTTPPPPGAGYQSTAQRRTEKTLTGSSATRQTQATEQKKPRHTPDAKRKADSTAPQHLRRTRPAAAPRRAAACSVPEAARRWRGGTGAPS
jgi:hypothetical protein